MKVDRQKAILETILFAIICFLLGMITGELLGVGK